MQTSSSLFPSVFIKSRSGIVFRSERTQQILTKAFRTKGVGERGLNSFRVLKPGDPLECKHGFSLKRQLIPSAAGNVWDSVFLGW